MNRTPKDVDDYLSTCDPTKRAALQKLRKQVHSIVPAATECISYQMPAFRLDGRLFVAYAAAVNHCSLFPCSGALIAAHRAELAGYDLSKGTIRFQPERPLPAALVRKLLKWRIAEDAGRAAAGRATRSRGARRRC